jgi:hypothetical protein
VRDCRSARGFVRHMREVQGLVISEYEILLIERGGDASMERKAGERKRERAREAGEG